MAKPMSAELVVETLIRGRQSERMAAQRDLELRTETINQDLARRLILEALSGPYAPLPEERKEDDPHNGARCWLLGSLAYVSASNDEPERTLRLFVQIAHEWNRWARYWALEAMYLAEASGQELSYRLSTRVAAFLGRNATERKAHLQQVKDLYGIRSKIAHGEHLHER